MGYTGGGGDITRFAKVTLLLAGAWRGDRVKAKRPVQVSDDEAWPAVETDSE